MPRYYAYARGMDPATGDAVVRGGVHVGGSPLAEKVLRVLRTPIGMYRPDKTYGVDISVVQAQRPNVQALWKAAVERALQRLIDRGELAGLRVIVDPPRHGRLLYDVEFYDPRDPALTPDALRRLAA